MPLHLGAADTATSDEDYTPCHHRTSDKHHNVRLTRPKQPLHLRTPFRFAYPPPNSGYKRLRTRPRLLLQVQQISNTVRPIPALDVLQSTTFARRLAHLLPNLFRVKDVLGSSHLIVVTSGSYSKLRDNSGSVSSEDDFSEHREVVATICQPREGETGWTGKAEIRFKQGPCWEAKPLPNGSYDFVGTGDDGQHRTVRWVFNAKHTRRGGSEGLQHPEPTTDFTFSVINPSTRQHPVIASLTRSGIDIVHHYPLSPTSTQLSSLPESIALGASKQSSDVESADQLETEVIAVNDDLRNLILTTGVWVFFRQGRLNSEKLSYVQYPLNCDKSHTTPGSRQNV
jgi:hypothetical protein